jgi:hypothetical protein
MSCYSADGGICSLTDVHDSAHGFISEHSLWKRRFARASNGRAQSMHTRWTFPGNKSLGGPAQVPGCSPKDWSRPLALEIPWTGMRASRTCEGSFPTDIVAALRLRRETPLLAPLRRYGHRRFPQNEPGRRSRDQAPAHVPQRSLPLRRGANWQQEWPRLRVRQAHASAQLFDSHRQRAGFPTHYGTGHRGP